MWNTACTHVYRACAHDVMSSHDIPIRRFEWQECVVQSSTRVCSSIMARLAVLSAVQIGIQKALEFSFIVFQKIQTKAQWIAIINHKKTGSRISTLGYAVPTSCLESEVHVIIHCHLTVPSVFRHTKGPVKSKLLKDMDRYDRAAETKKKRVENSHRLDAARSLLHLAHVGNGTAYCESH